MAWKGFYSHKGILRISKSGKNMGYAVQSEWPHINSGLILGLLCCPVEKSDSVLSECLGERGLEFWEGPWKEHSEPLAAYFHTEIGPFERSLLKMYAINTSAHMVQDNQGPGQFYGKKIMKIVKGKKESSKIWRRKWIWKEKLDGRTHSSHLGFQQWTLIGKFMEPTSLSPYYVLGPEDAMMNEIDICVSFLSL